MSHPLPVPAAQTGTKQQDKQHGVHESAAATASR